uniref:Acetyltransferase n=1 Tax=candidate division CPR3 bacterium TaxID=2268181 RepID=A0A7V3J928_UNCC3
MDKGCKILIFGAGGHGKVVLDILLESGADVLGFLDDEESKVGQEINGFKVLGGWSYLKNNKFSKLTKIALGIGNNNIREKIFRQAKDLGLSVVSAIHPKAIVSRSVKLGEGVAIMPGAIINSSSVLEDGVVVNTGATVDHDCYLERFCQIWPGAHLAGTVRVGEFSYVGTSASIIQNIKIGKNVIIGAGAAVVSDIPDNVTAVGVPARVIKKHA